MPRAGYERRIVGRQNVVGWAAAPLLALCLSVACGGKAHLDQGVDGGAPAFAPDPSADGGGLKQGVPSPAATSSASSADDDGGIPLEGGATSGQPSPEASTAEGSTFSSVLDFAPMNELDASAIGLPQALALGDLNGDGRTDIVVANLDLQTNRSNILVFLQLGDGSISAMPTASAFGTAPVAVADVNHDGRDDLLAGSGASVVVALQSTDGTLASPVSYSLPGETDSVDDIVTGNFDSQGWRDVIATSVAPLPGPGLAFLYPQTASGTLGSPQMLVTLGGPSARVADYNGDGLVDLITVGASGSGTDATSVGVLPQVSPGVFGSALEANQSGAALGGDFDVGDVTGDALLDVVTAISANRPASKVLVSTQQDGVLVGPVSYDSLDLPGPVCVVDVNMDGHLDVVVQHPGWFAVGVYLQKSDGTLAPEVTLSSTYGQANLAVGDVNGDGKPDIVTADQQKLVIFYDEN
jgi:hypothetical protein